MWQILNGMDCLLAPKGIMLQDLNIPMPPRISLEFSHAHALQTRQTREGNLILSQSSKLYHAALSLLLNHHPTTIFDLFDFSSTIPPKKKKKPSKGSNGCHIIKDITKVNSLEKALFKLLCDGGWNFYGCVFCYL